ncbi:hypothetical protein, partial [Thermus oshimai]
VPLPPCGTLRLVGLRLRVKLGEGGELFQHPLKTKVTSKKTAMTPRDRIFIGRLYHYPQDSR